ncbi:PAS domain-containing protein [Leisingera daeponensis]|uniref:protein-glutamate O-methyltransferase n=1 Tax=Leisingera daeponensis TaxID=405746 RepID=A0ABS7NFN2_9RHOB|nr:chemotaxis protein CheB [Leisingera daeponensis]MBY6140028.1 PAS domain-containing protein [Leisingera daeponensis]
MEDMDQQVSAGTPEASPGMDESLAGSDRGSLHVVGIAASAGGLEALSHLARNLPRSANAIYVIAQHMSPTHKSVLTSLIARETMLPVVELGRETEPEAGTIYITPPDTDVVLEDGVLRLRNPAGHPASPKPSADRLLKSIAEECGERCVGIVLSGTGSDGSYGVQAIREGGGITIAQEPGSAKYDGMPASAIETGCIDMILTPEQIGRHFEKILTRPHNLALLRPHTDGQGKLSELFGILLARTQVDFANYKENTLNRRVARRMTALAIDDYQTYVDYCRSNVDEVDALHRDLLISVTRFFRDPEQFRKLNEQLERQLANHGSGPLRIWVVGCATGEEAYSIAILVAELLGGLQALTKSSVQIFATDIDQNAIEVARKGIYPISAAQDIPASYLQKYFTVGENDIAVRQELRNVTLFSRHNVIQDPPFINVNLITIRNVLIYFNLALQERVLTRLHYSMAPGGLLFLGTSETVGEMGIYFEARHGADKIFGKRRGMSGELTVTPAVPSASYLQSRKLTNSAAQAATEEAAQADLSLARSVAPNGLICTRNGNIIEILGDISVYSEIRAGMSTSLNVKILIEPLRSEAASLIAVAIRNEARRDGRWHKLSLPTGNRVQLQAFPFYHQKGGEAHCLLAINSRFEEHKEISLDEISDQDQRDYVERMELEIRSTQEALQQTIEELQTANEELQSSNEELQSTNEEFQATNEELETSNEELQSSNEELLTVNEELQISSAERQALASEMEAMLASSPYAVALADQALIIRRLSRAAQDVFGIAELPPTGLHLSQCNLPAGFPALAPLANTVLRLQETRRIPVLSGNDYFTLILSPVQDRHHKLIGISITVTRFDNEPFSDVLKLVSKVTSVGFWTQNLQSNDTYLSPEAHAILGIEKAEEGLTLDGLLARAHPEDRIGLQSRLQELLKGGGSFEFEARFFDDTGGTLTIAGSLIVFQDSHGENIQLIGVCWDKAKFDERELMLSCSAAVQNHLSVGIFSFDVMNNVPVWTPPMFSLLGYTQGKDVPSVERLLERIHPEDRDLAKNGLQNVLTRGHPFHSSMRLQTRDDSYAKGELFAEARQDAAGRTTHVFGGIQLYRHEPE